MLFNSIDFGIFLPIVFVLYWFVFKNRKGQNAVIIIASYIFYGWWDWRFLGLILISTIVDFFVGFALGETKNDYYRKIIILTSIIVNLGFLGFFKYYNFFAENFVTAFVWFGKEINPNSLNIILPVGISFYTFQALSYTIDVYRKKLEPTKDIFVYSAYVCFFPQLVAGPIERATNLLPQFLSDRAFSYDKAADGLRQMLWGLFKKIVIADNCARFANLIFNNSSDYSGSTLFVGALFFSFQIYGDFSGYSDIAIGVSKLFGFRLMKNFAFPYFSRDIAEFWRRWHISLSTWFMDYVYIPLGGSRRGMWKTIRNIFLIFLISGFWHGANWTFIAWGALNAIYFLPLLILNINRNNLDVIAQGKIFPKFNEFLNMAGTFLLTVFAWVLFRANNISHAINYYLTIFSKSFLSIPRFKGRDEAMIVIVLVICFLLVEWIGRENEYAIEKIGTNWKIGFRWSFYYLLIVFILIYSGQEQQFIYFQF